MSRTWKKWTNEDDEYIAAAKARGTKYSTMAKKLGRTRAAVEQRVYNLRKAGLIASVQEAEQVSTSDTRHGKRWSDEEHNTMVRLHESGWTYTAIGAEIGRTPKAVADRLNNMKQFGDGVAPAQQVNFDDVVKAVVAELKPKMHDALDSFASMSQMRKHVEDTMWQTFESFRQTWEEETNYVTRKEIIGLVRQEVDRALVRQKVRLATHVEEPEAKPTRAERRAERRAAKKQAKIDRLTQRIQEMSE